MVIGGGLLLASQVRADLATRSSMLARGSDVTLMGPTADKAPSAAPTATPAPKTTPAPSRVPVATPHVRTIVKTVPAVKTSPHSSVNNLVPVAEVPVPSTTPTPGPTSTPAPPPTYAYTSSNWSGYLASAGTFTGVSGGWSVPQVSGNGHSTSADATWVGIGGVTSSDLIQVGTQDSVSSRGQVSSEAFYEMLPAVSTPVPGMTVTPGDVMSANITQVSSGQWKISITDVTQSESYNITVSYSSSLSTAEWIEEDPSYAAGRQIPFDDFGSVNFTGATMIENGGAQTLTGAGAQAIIMQIPTGNTVASPSGISGDGEGFTVSG